MENVMEVSWNLGGMISGRSNRWHAVAADGRVTGTHQAGDALRVTVGSVAQHESCGAEMGVTRPLVQSARTGVSSQHKRILKNLFNGNCHAPNVARTSRKEHDPVSPFIPGGPVDRAELLELACRGLISVLYDLLLQGLLPTEAEWQGWTTLTHANGLPAKLGLPKVERPEAS